MGIVKINDELHEDIRRTSTVMVRSINAQAEYWIKIGKLAEDNPNKTFVEIMQEQKKLSDIELRVVTSA